MINDNHSIYDLCTMIRMHNYEFWRKNSWFGISFDVFVFIINVLRYHHFACLRFWENRSCHCVRIEKLLMLDSRNAQFGHPVKKKRRLEYLWKLPKVTYLHYFAHIFFYKMILRMRFVPLEIRIQGIQFEHKFDPIRSSNDE